MTGRVESALSHRSSLPEKSNSAQVATCLVLAPFLLFLSFVLCCTLTAKPAFAADITTIDISGKGANTTIKITEPGAYRLTGSSSKAWIDVKVGNVDLYLTDGLNMTPGISANTGASCPSIKIEEAGGTVNIISEAGANAYLSSYLSAPAIQKEGNKTKLVFKTADPSNPGTITAKAPDPSCSAGIGSCLYVIDTSKASTGNMVFESGKVIAYGGTNAAGIGGGAGKDHTTGITIKGTAEVEAHGGGGGAGIGSGSHGAFNSIRIEGGTVRAYGGTGNYSGAGIGSGYDELSLTHGTVTITGGNVYAEGGRAGAGIGGSYRAIVDDIVISGGTIKAVGGKYGCGIGSGGGSTNKHYCKSIKISGGDITAFGGDTNNPAAIGNSGNSPGRQNITISGGIVRAYAQTDHAHAIGGGGTNGPGSQAYVTVDISGGTLIAKGGSKASAFGCNGNGYGTKKDKYFKATITGGSILVAPDGAVSNLGTFQVTPTDAAGNKLSPATAVMGELMNVRLDLSGAAAVVDGLTSGYEMNGVIAVSLDSEFDTGNQEVLFCPWLPSGTTLQRATAHVNGADVPYTGSVAPGERKTFFPSTKLTLDANGEGENGQAIALYGHGLEHFENATTPGHVLEFYTDKSRRTSAEVLQPNGTLASNVVVDGIRLTDENGNWVYAGGADISGAGSFYTLYAQTRPLSFTIHYDANIPASVSSTPTGDVPNDVEVEAGNLTEIGAGCTLALPGFQISSWNTEADGSGTSYDHLDWASISAAADGDVVTLYAQWKPRSYTVHFDGGGADSGSMADLKLEIGATAQLPANAFVKDGYKFVGWALHVSIGGAIKDQAWVTNLCAKNDDGSVSLDSEGSPIGLTLRALWVKTSDTKHDATIAVTLDGQAATALADRLTLASGDTAFAPFEQRTTSEGKPYFALRSTELLSAGTYRLLFDGKDMGKEVSVGDGADVVLLNFCTLETAFDGNLGGVDVVPSWPATINSKEVYLEGSEISLQARERVSGYLFDKWTGVDSIAQYADGATETSNPTTVVMRGPLTMRADSKPIDYLVSFDPNAPDASGGMADQKLSYGFEGKLPANAFARTGYVFTGWNTAADGTGDAYSDAQKVTNLLDSPGTITLYAQWEPIKYFLHFDGNLAGGPAMQSLEVAYNQSFTLPPCQFVFENEGLENSKFLGWNTARDGSGESFADGASVVNLCDEAGTSVTLYAQWEDPEPAPGPDPSPDPDPDPDPSPIPSPDSDPSDEPKPVPSPDTPSSSDAPESSDGNTSTQIPNTGDRAAALPLFALAASSLTLALAVLCLKTRGAIRKESK